MATEAEIAYWLAIWAAAAVFLLFRHWRSGFGAGLVLSYVLMFGVLHWFAPLLYLLPWHDMRGAVLTAEGLKQATLAMVAFAAGGEVAIWTTRHVFGATARSGGDVLAVDPRLARLYLVSGLVLYIFIVPIADRLPSLTAFVSTGSVLVVVGMGLNCWNGWVTGDRKQFFGWIAVSGLWPLVTVIGQGFLGFGFSFMLMVLAFVASFYRPRWKVVAAATLLAYVGLSVYVTYMRDRSLIRTAVWGQASLADRMTSVTDAVSDAEWFDPYNADHLARVDDRLNQDGLIGASVAYLSGRPNEFARGATLLDAAAAVIPRALWPDKPIVGGSGNMVSAYTGLRFAQGTSVGVGQVLEAYVNFGTDGVLVVFVALGTALVLIDRSAYRRLSEGNGPGFLIWYLPGLMFLQIGGSLSELTASGAAAFGMAFLLNRIALYRHWIAPHADDAAGALPDVPEQTDVVG